MLRICLSELWESLLVNSDLCGKEKDPDICTTSVSAPLDFLSHDNFGAAHSTQNKTPLWPL